MLAASRPPQIVASRKVKQALPRKLSAPLIRGVHVSDLQTSNLEIVGIQWTWLM